MKLNDLLTQDLFEPYDRANRDADHGNLFPFDTKDVLGSIVQDLALLVMALNNCRKILLC